MNLKLIILFLIYLKAKLQILWVGIFLNNLLSILNHYYNNQTNYDTPHEKR